MLNAYEIAPALTNSEILFWKFCTRLLVYFVFLFLLSVSVTFPEYRLSKFVFRIMNKIKKYFEELGNLNEQSFAIYNDITL